MSRVFVHLTSQAWRKSDRNGLSLRGVVFQGEDEPCEVNSLADSLVPHLRSPDACADAVRLFEGFFALVQVREGTLLAAVDHVRSIPLFFGRKKGEFFLSDSAEWVRNAVGNTQMDPVARDEFRLTGYVTGNETLYSDVKELQAGELLLVDTSSRDHARTEVRRYFRFDHAFPSEANELSLTATLGDRLHAAIRRLTNLAAGRQIVIPLSGGYDSRLIATQLCAVRYDNTLAFTYGAPGNKEADYSFQVARALGLKWYFVEYSKDRWRDAWSSAERRRYQDYAAGWSSIAHVQDWVAVRAMRQDGVLQPDCIFVPGHTCFRQNTGIHPLDDMSHPPDIELLIDRIRDRHYSRSVGNDGPSNELSIWRERIRDRAGTNEIRTWEALADAYERWEWQERQAKFICNSVRVYEFFGYSWWLPLWDTELVHFAQKVPLHLRLGRRWYNDFVRKLYAAHIGAPVEQTLRNAEDASAAGQRIRSILAGLPPSVQAWIKAIRSAIRARAQADTYIVSHMSSSEIRRLIRKGYRVDGMLVHEFLSTHQRDRTI